MIKLVKIALPVVVGLLWGVLVSGKNDNVLEAQMNTLKQECKDMIKGTRYEGSRITYFTSGASKQVKSVEVYMFLLDEYKFAISAKKCSAPLTIRIYDAPASDKDRVLIKEFKKVQGTNLKFTKAELNNAYQEKLPDAYRLRNIHIEYAIGAGKGMKEGIVLVYGVEP